MLNGSVCQLLYLKVPCWYLKVWIKKRLGHGHRLPQTSSFCLHHWLNYWGNHSTKQTPCFPTNKVLLQFHQILQYHILYFVIFVFWLIPIEKINSVSTFTKCALFCHLHTKLPMMVAENSTSFFYFIGVFKQIIILEQNF
jgi:hypothetical protein